MTSFDRFPKNVKTIKKIGNIVFSLCSKHSCTKNFSAFWLCVNLEQGKNLNEAGGGGVKEEMLACKPLDFKKHPLVFTVELIY